MKCGGFESPEPLSKCSGHALIEGAPGRFRFRFVFTDVWRFENQAHEVTDGLIHVLCANMDLAIVRWYVNGPRTLWDDVETSDRMTPFVANERLGHLETLFVSVGARLGDSN